MTQLKHLMCNVKTRRKNSTTHTSEECICKHVQHFTDGENYNCFIHYNLSSQQWKESSDTDFMNEYSQDWNKNNKSEWICSTKHTFSTSRHDTDSSAHLDKRNKQQHVTSSGRFDLHLPPKKKPQQQQQKTA